MRTASTGIYFVWTHKDDPQVKTFVTKTEEDSRNRNRWNKVEGSDYLYYSYFGKHMPDLNFDSPSCAKKFLKLAVIGLLKSGLTVQAGCGPAYLPR